MKHFLSGLLALIPAISMAYMADGEASNSGEGESAAAAEARKRAAASNFLPIVRGRLPLLFVHAVRFDEAVGKMSNKDLATKLGTSVGKVFDIRKGRNFAYVDTGWKPTNEDIGAAESWIKQIGEQNTKGLAAVGDKSMLQGILDQYKARGLASAEEAAAQSAARAPAKPAAKTAASTTLPGGESQTLSSADVGTATADDLLG
jgi:hypothetical protein